MPPTPRKRPRRPLFARIVRGLKRRLGLVPTKPDDPRYRENRIGWDVKLGSARLEGESQIVHGCRFRGDVTLGRRSTVGRRCVLHGGTITVGRYCQLGPEVAIYALDHPLGHVTTYVNLAFPGAPRREHLSEQIVEIGNDVWIGHGAIVVGSVKIGDGAVVGAGAVVVKDVAPYAIVAGNPARVVRARFPEDVVEMLLELRWWDWPDERIAKHEALFAIDGRASIDELRRALREVREQGC